MTPSLALLSETIEPLRQQLLAHSLYPRMRTLADLRVFMELHGFAVLDFMSLLKALQRKLTCVRVPWVPVGDPRVRLLINQIVLGEESDMAADGRPCSHFELYLEAMEEAGADTAPLRAFVDRLAAGEPPTAALAPLPECVRRFVGHTFHVIEHGGLHEVAAAFTFGREDLIPAMFTELVHAIGRQHPDAVATLRYYLERHIELDGDEHGALGRQMVALLCGDDPRRWQEARTAAAAALSERLALWDGIQFAIAAHPTLQPA